MDRLGNLASDEVGKRGARQSAIPSEKRLRCGVWCGIPSHVRWGWLRGTATRTLHFERPLKPFWDPAWFEDVISDLLLALLQPADPEPEPEPEEEPEEEIKEIRVRGTRYILHACNFRTINSPIISMELTRALFLVFFRSRRLHSILVLSQPIRPGIAIPVTTNSTSV